MNNKSDNNYLSEPPPSLCTVNARFITVCAAGQTDRELWGSSGVGGLRRGFAGSKYLIVVCTEAFTLQAYLTQL